MHLTLFKNYIRSAVRNLSKNKIFSAINIFGLAISMSVGLLIISFVNELNSKIGKLGNLKASFILVLGYVLFMLLSQIFHDFGFTTTATIIRNVWLIFVIYSWVGIPLYYKQLNKELEKFEFNKGY